MSSSTFGAFGVEQQEDNPVIVPRGARACKGPHKYDPTLVNNKAVGYVPVPYDPAEHEFPKMLYHPKWGQTKAPDMAKFSIGCTTPEQYQAAFTAYSAAEEKWRRSNRSMIAKTAEDEKRLKDKGWLTIDKLPERKEAKAFDLSSEEI